MALSIEAAQFDDGGFKFLLMKVHASTLTIEGQHCGVSRRFALQLERPAAGAPRLTVVDAFAASQHDAEIEG